MTTIERSIDVQAPLDFVYDEFRRVEAFPRFMEGITEVRRNDRGGLEWRAEVDGREHEWEEIVVDEVEGERLAWRSTGGPSPAVVATFVRLNDTTTTVTLHIDYEPQGFVEDVRAALGAMERQVEENLSDFARTVERAHAGSGWHDPARR